VWSGLPEVAEVRPDGSVLMRGRVWGAFSQPRDLQHFPFDTQRIAITLVAAGFEALEWPGMRCDARASERPGGRSHGAAQPRRQSTQLPCVATTLEHRYAQ